MGRTHRYVWWKWGRVSRKLSTSPFLLIYAPQTQAGPDREVLGDKGIVRSSRDIGLKMGTGYSYVRILYSTPS